MNRRVVGALAAVVVAGAVGIGCGGDDDQTSMGDPPGEKVSCADGVVVFLEPDVDDGRLDEVADELASDGDVVALFDQDRTYEEFLGLFADVPQIANTVTADILPPSVRIRAASAVAADELARRAATIEDVREVVRPSAEPIVAEFDLDVQIASVWCTPGFPFAPQQPVSTTTPAPLATDPGQ